MYVKRSCALNTRRTKYYLPRRKGYAANDLELDDSTNVQPLNIIQNPSALVAKPYGKKWLTSLILLVINQ